MRNIFHLALLLIVGSSPVLASSAQQVELIVFRQGSSNLPASHVAPDLWAQGAPMLSRESQRSTQLDYLANKLTAENGYQVVLHQSWLQADGDPAVALTTGPAFFEHYPVQGTLTLSLARHTTVHLDLWLNQFNADKTLLSSERFKHKATVKRDQVTFIDHYPFGALIRIQPYGKAKQSAVQNDAHAAEFE